MTLLTYTYTATYTAYQGVADLATTVNLFLLVIYLYRTSKGKELPERENLAWGLALFITTSIGLAASAARFFLNS